MNYHVQPGTLETCPNSVPTITLLPDASLMNATNMGLTADKNTKNTVLEVCLPLLGGSYGVGCEPGTATNRLLWHIL